MTMDHIEYVCLDCIKIFTMEEAKRHSEGERMKCPVCGSEDWEQLPENVSTFLEDMLDTQAQ